MLALSVKDLVKEYPNQMVALKGINLNVEEGDFFALLGPNGAGKSTTIGIISSLVNKTSGSVKVFGHDMDKERDLAKLCIGVVPQEMNFNPFEKIFQIMINQAGYYGVPRKVAAERAEFYLKKMGIWEKHNQIGLRLSGGMKRRLMIARALVNKPRLLILDEPTAGVDIELRHILWQFLTELNQQGTTIILTTHYLEEAEHLCKNLAIIDHGKIIENANVKVLINRLNVQTIILDLQQPLNADLALADYHTQKIDEMTLEVRLNQQQSLNELFKTLSQQGLSIKSMRNKTNRLEELFIDLISENKQLLADS
jgi:ABC-2 type transport system ATP-binding protein